MLSAEHSFDAKQQGYENQKISISALFKGIGATLNNDNSNEKTKRRVSPGVSIEAAFGVGIKLDISYGSSTTSKGKKHEKSSSANLPIKVYKTDNANVNKPRIEYPIFGKPTTYPRSFESKNYLFEY